MEPPAVKLRLPPLCKVVPGRAILAEALEKFSVKLRKADNEVKLVGAEAAALVLVKLKSWTLLIVAPAAKLMLPLRLLFWLSCMFELAVFSVKVMAPAEAA